MRSALFLGLYALAALPFSTFAQTSTSCDPTKQSCPADTALGGTVSVALTSASDDFSVEGTGSVDFTSDGAVMTVAKSGDSPLLVSNWHIMFGRVDVTMTTAAGTGLVSSVVLLSDDLDEIDWEWLGGEPDDIQTNYFSRGVGDSSWSTKFANPGHNTVTHTYSFIWTSESITWLIDGAVIRTLTAAQAGTTYPQTPMKLKLGPWAGGDVNTNSAGTVAWAGGATDFSQGPFKMVVKSVTATDYSTGSAYVYGDQSGLWTSIQAVDGTINGNLNGNVKAPSSSKTTSSVSSSSSSSTTLDSVISSTSTSSSSTTLGTPVPDTMDQATVTSASYPGLPSGWTVTSSGKVRPPSSTASAGSVPLSSSPSPTFESTTTPTQGTSESTIITTIKSESESVSEPSTNITSELQSTRTSSSSSSQSSSSSSSKSTKASTVTTSTSSAGTAASTGSLSTKVMATGTGMASVADSNSHLTGSASSLSELSHVAPAVGIIAAVVAIMMI